MYLSHLLIDIGYNPDRPRPGRLWLRNIYHVHQRLCMAFPSTARKADDPDFLKPYKPEDFGGGNPKQVHEERKVDSGFLFRIEPQAGSRVVILVQSAIPPDWEYAFHNAGHFLAAPIHAKLFEPHFEAGQLLRFRLLANPTRRLSKHSTKKDGSPIDAKNIGDRVPVPADKLDEWLQKQGKEGGFSIEEHLSHHGYVYFKKPKGEDGNRLFSVHFEGILSVTNPDAFLHKAVIKGIGPAKAFGFGLLSVMPVSPTKMPEAE